MSDDWDLDDEPVKPSTSTPALAPALPKTAAKSKWQGEDEESEEDDWDASDSDKPKAKATTNGAPAVAPKKKMTLKQKLAEKERLAAEANDDELIDTMTIQEKRRLARERELEADLATAADLMGLDSGDSADDLKTLLQLKPSTKAEFAEYSSLLMSALISQHASNPLYASFVENLSKDLCEGLTAVQTRKVSSALSILGNTKQQEERDKASGKKKAATKPKLGAVKSLSSKVDTEAYDDVLEDDDFM
ncbi:translation initiation factor 3 subunit J, partial [Tremellales sp. Uapishka_1]